MATTQPLAYHLRLPDAAQPQARHLLTIAQSQINAAITTLWPRLDEFGGEREGPAWKQVETMYTWPDGISNRLGRCFTEQVGRILRAQASRKNLFVLLAPILHAGMLHKPSEKHPHGGKNRTQMRQDLQALQKAMDDGGNYVALMSLLEQACNFYLTTGTFPASYEELQPVPVLETAQLTYAADDGMDSGQAYQMRFRLDNSEVLLWLRQPEDDGTWDRHWRDEKRATVVKIPPCVVARLQAGEPMAPTLRAIQQADSSGIVVLDLFVETPVAPPPDLSQGHRVLGFDWGVRTLVTATVLEASENTDTSRQISRQFFLDTGGFDGRQARNRRQTDYLKRLMDGLLKKRNALAPTDPRRDFYDEKLARLNAEKQACWKKYAARNRELAHLAANVLILLVAVFDCKLIAGESLKTLKTTGRGRGTKGRWQHWRNNTQIRGELWRVLTYKCVLAGIRLASQYPRGTSHTCPRCGKPAKTYAAPDRLHEVMDWGHWLHCEHCGYHADRDYAASLNIARLGLAWLAHYQATKRSHWYSVTDPSVKPASYTGVGSALLFPPTTPLGSPTKVGTIFLAGWTGSVWFSSSYNRRSIFVLSQTAARKSLLRLLTA